MTEAEERYERSPKKVTTHEAKCGSSWGLLIYFSMISSNFFVFVKILTTNISILENVIVPTFAVLFTVAYWTGAIICYFNYLD